LKVWEIEGLGVLSERPVFVVIFSPTNLLFQDLLSCSPRQYF